MTATVTPTPNTTGTTSTRDFLSSLTDQGAKVLVFDFDGHQIRPGYHVTEVKAASFETMDCGGQGNLWFETIVQLMPSPAEESQGFMTVEKFLSIYNRVSGSIPVRAQAEILFEYGDDGEAAIHYHVRGVNPESEAVIVHLEPTRVSCKAADRRAALSGLTMLETVEAGSSSCCGPSSAAASAPSKCC